MICSVGGKSFDFKEKGACYESDSSKKEKALGLAFGDALTEVIDAIPQKFIEEIKK